ncbi:MAG TPA: NADH-ubiquinone oxidoreductase-F iron-sulfur binding region domain-containing protein [Acidimicrobiales bacterium]
MTAAPLSDLAACRLPRLLPQPRDPSYAAHWEQLGPLPAPGRGLIDEVLASGLRGRGGARFPTGRKMAAVAAGRGPAVLVANGTEGEPLSAKDRALLVGNPHLVLDGIAAAAAAVGADRILLAVERARPDTVVAVRQALAERPPGPVIELLQTPSRYVAGQETALVRWIDGGDAKPVFGSRPFLRGVGGRPTLVDNVETLAHIGLIARFGADWFRLLGTDDEPGSALVTVSGAVRHRGVYEIPVGYSVGALLDHVEAAPAQALLIGGYFGAWIPGDDLTGVHLSSAGLAAAGASPGSGVIVAIPEDACALAEVATVAEWYASHSAGQCGPCVFGLADIARAVRGVLAGDPDGETAARRWTAMVRGRGACHFPDGAATFVDSALDTLVAEVADHRHGRCRRRIGGYLPSPAPGSWR